MKSNRMRGNNLTMKKIKVGVIFGGQSTEHDVSIISGSSVIKNLSKDKYEIYPIYISRSGEWFNYIKPVKEVDIFNIGEEPEELEKITTELEKGNLSLDESVEKFEEGMKLSKQCNDMIEKAEKKITMLIQKEGKLEEENFDVE